MIGRFIKKEWWYEYCQDAFATGSRVICDPPVLDTDEDYLLLVEPSVVKHLEERLVKEGFEQGGSLKNRTTGEIEFETISDLVLEGYKSQGWKVWDIYPDNIHKIFRHKKVVPEELLEFPDMSDPDKKGLFRSWKKPSEITGFTIPDPLSTTAGSINYIEKPVRSSELNLIVTCSVEYFNNFFKATRLATQLNLLKKADRVRLFEAVCHDKWN